MKEGIRKEKLAIRGMHCKSCEMLITDSLMEIDGVSRVTIDHAKGTGEVEFNPQRTGLKEITKVVKEQGYDCKVVV